MHASGGTRVTKRLGALLLALGLVLMVAAPAFANDLHQATPISFDSTAFPPGDGDCVGVQPGTVVWHFVHTDTSVTDLPSTLTAWFTDNNTAAITSQTVSGYVNGSSIVMYDVTTTTDVSLTSASDTIENADTGGLLNLSHICNGGPPPEVPEAPFSVLLVVTAAIVGVGFVGWKMRQAGTTA
jgi:hypothetical protein